MTCWRRLRDWQRAGVWDLMHFALLDWLARSARLIGRGRSWTVVPSAPSTAVTRPVQIPLIGPSAGASAIYLRRAGRAALGSPDWRQPKRLARGTGVAGCDSATPGRAGTAAASPRLCGGRPRLRCRGNPTRVANSRHPAAVGDAPHQARQRFGNLALGRRADISLAQSVSTPPCPLRQAGRHTLESG
jgi:hypothetical protein